MHNLDANVGYYFVGIPVTSDTDDPPVAGANCKFDVVKCPVPFNLYTNA